MCRWCRASTCRKGPLIVGLIATPERIVQIRSNRLLSINELETSDYVDREAVIAEIAATRKLCARQGWPLLDVTRRSIEETAAAVIALYQDHRSDAAS
jgi:[pyruvate, water dikinase]-phosphate phosphotransferase / [pyruvate, water dikinase] kinase